MLALGFAIRRTPMHSYTHGREGWFQVQLSGLSFPSSVRSGVLFRVIDHKHLNGCLAYFQFEA
jgi:hypothetical protein